MAAQKLEGFRKKLVERLSAPVIKILLDDLFEDGVLNDMEKDAILEENVGRADKARDLIDFVRKKGDEASGKFIAHLEVRDPMLYKQIQ